MDWKNKFTKTPYLVLFIVLIAIGVGTASALITITLAGDVIITGDTTLQGDLTVSDGITSDDYNFPSPKTKLKIITSISFDAPSAVTVKSKNVNGIGKYISSTSTEFTPLSAPINIPDGATIKTVTCFVLDNSPTEDVECSLLSYLLGSAPGIFASVSTSGEDPSNQQILMTGLSETNFGQFFVTFEPTDKACDSLCAIFRVDVTYEISKAG